MTDGKTSVGNLLARAIFLVEWQVCMLSVKLGFHDSVQAVLYIALALIAAGFYAAKVIPRKFTVFSEDVTRQLKAFESLIQLTKQNYKKMCG